uniref:NADH-ubiquinone oxidoreductase chain 6 n=1 Tax=Telchinia polis TaxID=501958 RepID=A0A140CVE5_9NEOP|nr:NADH dehydrogenase subunit 6 [Telchinia polis]AMJ17269.1 NADH dehydrogenase subunit 6 [Telchinia polis]
MFFSNLIFFLCLFMFFTSHPMAMGMMILSQTLLVCSLSGMLISTYWFSYILFLIFLGGLLVLFIYVSSIASNELFKINLMNKSLFVFSVTYSLIISWYMKDNLSWANFSFNEEMIIFPSNFLFFNNEFNFNLTKLYNEQTYLLMFLSFIYLFITLIAVIKITNIFFGPLRSMYD